MNNQPTNSNSNVKDDNKHVENDNKPTCIIVLGMAGSGKTTFVQVNIIN